METNTTPFLNSIVQYWKNSPFEYSVKYMRAIFCFQYSRAYMSSIKNLITQILPEFYDFFIHHCTAKQQSEINYKRIGSDSPDEN